jgi:two-component system chemotaxis sensor kinase CheA
METQEAEFIERLRATFKVEADEHLQAISACLLDLEKPSPTSSSAPSSLIENIYREAHSLKGAARAVDFSEIEAICQALESAFSEWKRRREVPSPQAFDLIHRALDRVRGSLDAPSGNGHAAGSGTEELTRRLSSLASCPPPGVPSTATVPGVSVPLDKAPAASAQGVQVAQAPAANSEKAPPSDTVRISLAKLDLMLLQSEDLLTVKAMAASRAGELRTIIGLFDQWHGEWAKVSAGARSARRGRDGDGAGSIAVPRSLVDFLDWNCDYLRAMENKLRALMDQSEQERHGIARRVDDLLEGSKKLLMLPFSTIAALLPKLVRDLCRDQGKEADLIIQGGEVEIDKRILEEIKDALIHVLRNCVDHGVEKRAERERLGKPPRATLTIAVSQVNGSKVEIMVSDDGAGVDLVCVKASAVRRNILSEADARTLSDAQALPLVFHSDVSASPIVTAISGRGLGMAIVRTKVDKLGGHVTIDSQRQVGTTLRMILPLTLATFRGVLVRVMEQTFVIPMAKVKRVLRVKPSDVTTVENRQVLTIEGNACSLVRLASVLRLPPPTTHGGASEPLSVVLLQSGDERVAFVVDEVLREEEVLVKPLRKPLVRVPNIGGATVLGSGKAVLVLNVADLLKSARHHGAPAPVAADVSPKVKAPAKRVLVVEDSITSRMLLKGILESAGYHVTVAIDGVDAFTALRENRFDLVVSDVEMPRMNGFDLAGRIRADKRLGELPVVLVTALESPEERERGIDAGANAYIVKSNFDQSRLVETIRRLI